MPTEPEPKHSTPEGDNEHLFRDLPSDPGLLVELVDFLRTSKKWWMLPLLLVFVLLAVVLILSQTVATPFIYTVF